MKKIAILLLVCAVFSGCYTLSDRKGPNDVTAVMKVNRIFLDTAGKEIKMPDKYVALHAYYVTVDDDPTLHVIQQDYYQVFLNGLSPGPHKISSIRVRLISSSTGQEIVTPVSIPFELRPGCLTILPKAFNIVIQITGTRGYSYWNGFTDLKSQERAGLIDKLRAYSSFKTWELAE